MWLLVNDHSLVWTAPNIGHNKLNMSVIKIKKKKSGQSFVGEHIGEKCKRKMGGRYKYILLYMHIFEIPKEQIIKINIKPSGTHL